MEVNGAMLAAELRRRRVRPQSLLSRLGPVRRSTWVPGDLEATPTPLLVLAALSLTGSQHDGGPASVPLRGAGPSGPPPAAAPRRRSPG